MDDVLIFHVSKNYRFRKAFYNNFMIAAFNLLPEECVKYWSSKSKIRIASPYVGIDITQILLLAYHKKTSTHEYALSLGYRDDDYCQMDMYRFMKSVLSSQETLESEIILSHIK